VLRELELVLFVPNGLLANKDVMLAFLPARVAKQ
jgi:hypothetical protein